MIHPPDEKGRQVDQAGHTSGERLVYVMPAGAAGLADEEINLRELFHVFWLRKWLIISIMAIVTMASIAYALVATEWYRAELLLIPAQERATPSIGSQLGGLALLAGVSIGGDDSVEAVATLKSQEFARDFINDFALLPVLLSDQWDAERERWKRDDSGDWPDVRDAVKYFQDEVLDVNEDPQTGLVTLSIEWTDPEVAAKWADALVRRLNSKLRARALHEAEFNASYLQEELGKTSIVTLHQTISRLLEGELQKIMLARGNEEFAFRVIDAPGAPKDRVWPKRRLVVFLGMIVGGILGVVAAFIVHIIRSEPEGEHLRET